MVQRCNGKVSSTGQQRPCRLDERPRQAIPRHPVYIPVYLIISLSLSPLFHIFAHAGILM